MSLAPGLSGEAKTTVTHSNTATAIGSGGVEVFSTPHMIGLMEMAAATAVQPHLAAGQVTVGTKVEISHLAPTPLGMEITARATLLEADGRRLVFAVEAYDAAEKIGEGHHERFVVSLEKFMARTAAKGE